MFPISSFVKCFLSRSDFSGRFFFFLPFSLKNSRLLTHLSGFFGAMLRFACTFPAKTCYHPYIFGICPGKLSKQAVIRRSGPPFFGYRWEQGMDFSYDKQMGSRIRLLREARHLTQEQLAAKLQVQGCDITRSGLAKIEAGQRHVYPDELFV